VKKILLVLLTFASALALAQSGAPPSPKTPSYAMEVKISPMPGAAGQYVGEATVQDLSTGQTVFAPRVQVQAGRSGVASNDAGKGKLDYTLSVSVEGEGKQANFQLEVHDGETLLASEKAAVKLR
jgi:hypothetical protein